MKKIFINFAKLLLIFLIALNLPLGIQATSCNNEKPDHAPDLFQINMTKDKATLYFTPVNNAVTGYTIFYGFDRGDERYNVSFPYGTSDGVISYTINDLSPNTRYYFKVRADNGCRKGYWSDTLSARTNWIFKMYTRVK